MKFKTQSEYQESFAFPGWSVSDEENPRLVEDSGYVPLDIRIKQYKLAGMASQLHESMFDYKELKEVFKDDKIFNYSDDKMDIIDKLNKVNEKYAEVLRQRAEEENVVASESADVVETEVTVDEPVQFEKENVDASAST